MISQKSFDIADFFYFEETFRSECSERNERRGAESGAKAGVPFRGGRSGGRSECSDRNERKKRLMKISKHQRS